jgi:hypothetical protein
MVASGSTHARVLRVLRLAVGLVGFAVGSASAANITYLFSGMIEGTLGGQPFAAPAIIGTLGDPAAVVNGAVRCNDITYASVIWGPNYESRILSPLSIVVSNGSSYAGLRTGTCAAAGSDWLHVSAAQFGAYNLATAIGPMATTGSYVNGGIGLSTTDGTLVLTWQSLTTFEADVNLAPRGAVAVPTLGEWALAAMACALAALGVANLRRRRV